ncbi:MAG: MMPL family transporter [Lachnospiraceae bacterium]|nr:MMPL family transporter [Lachnospiraceae bacterium]
MISGYSVKRPYTVFVAVVLVIVLGVVSFTKMTTDLLPSMNLPYAIVMTTYAGASPETVESIVTRPVEQSMATVSNIENVSSLSAENYSLVILEFAQTANMDSVTIEMRENLDQLKAMWEDDSIGSPIIMKLNPDMMPVMVAAVGKEGLSHTEVTKLTEDLIIPELESLEGVASVNASGLIEENVQVVIRQEKIDAINEQVFGYVESEFEDAQKEIEDGKKELADGQKELNDGQIELNDSIAELQENQADLAENKQDLEEGLDEVQGGIDALNSKKTETAAQLAAAQTAINNGKAEITKNLAMIEPQIAQRAEEYKQAKQMLPGLQEVVNLLKVLKTNAEVANDADPTGAAGDAVVNNGIQEIIKNLDDDTLKAMLGGISNLAALDTKIEEMNSNISEVEAGIKQYEELLKSRDALKATDAQLSQQLTEANMGEMIAAIEMGSASATLSITKSQLKSAKEQLESAEEQLTDAWDQISDAQEQLNDARKQLSEGWDSIKEGEEELAEAKEDALANADMTDILTVEMVENLLAAQNFSMPAGYVTEEGIDYLVRVGEKVDDVESLQNMVLIDMEMDGVDTIHLSDVADVFMTDNSDKVYASINGQAGVMLTIQKQTGYSTGDVSDRINKRIGELQEEDPELLLLPLMDQGVYIELVTDSVFNNMISGAFLAILILLVFLKDLRPTLVIACSIPISVVAAVVCMYFSGVTLNIISLSGLALGIGMLVDNSIVVIENIYRLRNEGMSAAKAAMEGAKEVAGAIAASTLTTVCVFLPIVFTEGITRQLFVDMGLTIAYSLGASLAVALTLVPAMGAGLLKNTKEKKPSRLFERMMETYEGMIRFALRRRAVVLILAVGLLVLSAVLEFAKGTAFMPEMDSTEISMTLTMPEGTPLKETAEQADELERRLLTLDDVLEVGAMSASGNSMGLVSGDTSTNEVSLYGLLKEDKKLTNQELKNEILKLTEDMEAEIDVATSSMDMSALGGSGISVMIKGRDLDRLQEIAKDIAKLVEEVEGTIDVSDGVEETTGELRIKVDKERAAQQGLTTAGVFSQIMEKLSDPASATTLSTDTEDFDVLVVNGNDVELTRETIKDLVLTVTKKDNTKEHVPLADIAEFSQAEGLETIQRDAQSRYITVTAAIDDTHNVGLVSNEVEKKLQSYQAPEGYTIEMQGENEAIMESMIELVKMLLLALLFMYLIMVAQFQSLLSPFIIMFTVPLAFTGGLFGLFFAGSEFSVIAMIGFVMLSGIIVNNGIVLIDYTNQLIDRGMSKTEALVEAGKTRMRPILMTALTTVLGLSTMGIGVGMGADMVQPMAIVTIGGLLYGTLLTLFVIPCIYSLLIRRKTRGEVE